MSFTGTSITFNGIPSDDFGLILYAKIDNATQKVTSFASPLDIQEDRPLRKYRPYCYGGGHKDVLNFTLVLGCNEERAYTRSFFDAFDRERIAGWLTGFQDYRWLTIQQDDLQHVRYYCRITDLEAIEVGGHCVGFEAAVQCDSAYAYMRPKTTTITVSGTKELIFHNRSSMNEPYLPKLEITLSAGNSISIVNASDGGREFAFRELPASVGKITVDNERMIMTDSNGTNLYSCWNKKTFRLQRGDNNLTITGNGTVSILTEFPVNVGG